MNRDIQIIVAGLIFLLVISAGLYLTLKKRDIGVTDTTSTSVTYRDFDSEGIVKEIYGSLVKITVIGGEDRDFLLMDRVVYLCLPEDEEYYNYLKNIDRESLETSYLIKREEVPDKIDIGDSVELFLFEYTPEKIFIKGIAKPDC